MISWDEVLQQEKHRPKFPSVDVIYFARMLKDKGMRRVLDLGCGTGRHTLFFSQQEFETYAIDDSRVAIDFTQVELDKNSKTAEIMKCDISSIPYPDNYFDAVLSYYVLPHGALSYIQKAVDGVHRTLRPNGLFMLTLNTTQDWRWGKGEQIEENTFVQLEGEEAGITHHFFTEKGVYQLLDRFKIVLFRESTVKELYINGEKLDPPRVESNWLVIAEKFYDLNS